MDSLFANLLFCILNCIGLSVINLTDEYFLNLFMAVTIVILFYFCSVCFIRPFNV